MKQGVPYREWWHHPISRGSVVILAISLLLAPAWLMADTIRAFALFGDDFLYLADARDFPTLRATLFEPHNTHVVPLFRAWTYFLAQLAWSKENWPIVFGIASYLALVLAMLAIGHWMARETRQVALGMAGMACLGITTTMEPVIEWYSAGQALWSGIAVLGTLIAVQSWRQWGGRWRLVTALIAALSAPLLWTGGLAAGPAAGAYLLASPKRGTERRLAALFLVATALSSAFIVLQSRQTIARTEIIWEEHHELWPRPIQAVLHTAQAIAEVLILHNLGIATTTTEAQAGFLVLAVAAAWAWTRRRSGFRLNSLEAPGLVIVVFSDLLVYVFRGNLPFSSLREVQWYHAVPHIGAVLFLAGWWTGSDVPGPGSARRPTRAETLGILILAGILLLLHGPLYRAETIQEASVPPIVDDGEGRGVPFPRTYDEARIRAQRHASAQREALARLDAAEAMAWELHITREALERAIGHAAVPGMPGDRAAYHALDLLSLPSVGQGVLEDRVRERMHSFLRSDHDHPDSSATQPFRVVSETDHGRDLPDN